MLTKENLIKISDYLWEIPKSFRADMRVPARIYADAKLLEKIFGDRSLDQLVNVATLPGILNYALAMPDMHEGYGFPIGGVAGLRAEDGVISPGGVGYDINCTPADTQVSLDHGTYLTIGELEKSWQEATLNSLNLFSSSLKKTKPILFLKKRNNPSILEIEAISGRKIKATDDHPLFTKQGMKEAAKIKVGEKIASLPFKGVKFEAPGARVILEEDQFIKVLKEAGKSSRGSSLNQILNYIRGLNILPLRYSSWQLPYLLKIMGYVLGDGSISFIRGKGVVWFYGKRRDLEKISEDIKKIGFVASKVYNRTRNHKIKTRYGHFEFQQNEESIKVVSTAFACFLIALGVPFGHKVAKEYAVPKWLMRCRLWQKRLFLAAFFGAELSSPKFIISHKYNFYCPTLNINKLVSLKKNGMDFLFQIKQILKEFGVATTSIKEVPGYTWSGKLGRTCGLRFQILGNLNNLLKFFETVGYEYNGQKQALACWVAHYLRLKSQIIKQREEARKLSRKLYKKISLEELFHKTVNPPYVTKQFIEHSIWGLGRDLPRVSFDFFNFDEYKKKFVLGKDGLVWDEVKEIKKTPFADWVYDLTVNDKDHNFIANNFVVSNCGVRVLRSDLTVKDVEPHLVNLMNQIQRDVPSGVGRGGEIELNPEAMRKVLEQGVRYVVEKGYGEKEDIEYCEEQGNMVGANDSCVSEKAKDRGRDQLGTLGSGNHFLEVQKVDEIFDDELAEIFGLKKDQVTVMIHSGSRGLGHQVCTDYVSIMHRVLSKFKINLPDPELACVPFKSEEGQRYFAAMAASANFAWANRQLIMHLIRKAWQRILGDNGGSLKLIYDVAHNIAKIEEHDGQKLIVHRKGATRAFPPGRKDIPEKYRPIGQPILIPGTMGTASYILAGTEKASETFFSVCHGAGRVLSRHAALRAIEGSQLRQKLESQGIIVRCLSNKGLAEEAPMAYKDINNVVEVVVKAGLAKLVARLKPMGVVKG